jgi:hypothetical protein
VDRWGNKDGWWERGKEKGWWDVEEKEKGDERTQLGFL